MELRVPTDPAADDRTLLRAARRFRLTLGVGVVLVVLGAGYGLFAAARLGAPRVHEDFDRPIARTALVIQSCGAERRRFEPASEREAVLLADLEQHAATASSSSCC